MNLKEKAVVIGNKTYRYSKIVMLQATNSQVDDKNQLYTVAEFEPNTKYPLRLSGIPNSPTSFRKECRKQHLYFLSTDEMMSEEPILYTEEEIVQLIKDEFMNTSVDYIKKRIRIWFEQNKKK